MEEKEMMEIMVPLVTNPMAYIGALLGLLALEQRIYDKLTPNGETRFQKWKKDRLDDIVIGFPMAMGMVSSMNYVWYWQDISFTWSNFWTGLATGLAAMAIVYAFLDLLPAIFVVVKDKVIDLIKKFIP